LLGWFRKDQLVPEVATIAFKINAGEKSDVITSSLGFHIIFVEEKRKIQGDDETEIEEVKLKQIFTRDGGFLDWLVNKKRGASVSIFMRDYYWDTQEGKVEFRNEAMRRTEEKIKIESEGDPSI